MEGSQLWTLPLFGGIFEKNEIFYFFYIFISSRGRWKARWIKLQWNTVNRWSFCVVIYCSSWLDGWTTERPKGTAPTASMAAGGWDVIRKPDSFSLLVLSGHLCRVGAFSSRQIAPLVGNERSSSKFNCFRWSMDWTVSLISIKWNSDGPDLWLLIAVIFSNLEIFDRFNVMTSIGCTWSLGLKSLGLRGVFHSKKSS